MAGLLSSRDLMEPRNGRRTRARVRRQSLLKVVGAAPREPEPTDRRGHAGSGPRGARSG